MSQLNKCLHKYLCIKYVRIQRKYTLYAYIKSKTKRVTERRKRRDHRILYAYSYVNKTKYVKPKRSVLQFMIYSHQLLGL